MEFKQKKTTLTKKSRLTAGKYKNLYVDYILTVDPKYLMGIENNPHSPYKLDDKLFVDVMNRVRDAKNGY